MKTSTLWIIRIALTVQFMGVLAVPALVASAEAPRATWMAEWLQASPAENSASAPERDGRTIGVLKLRDGKLSFDEQVGQAGWTIELASLKRVVIADDDASTSLRAGRGLVIESNTGEVFVVAILEPNMTVGSPKKVLATIDRALQVAGVSAGNR